MLKDEREIIKRCLKGEKKAMEMLVVNYQKGIFNYFYRNVKNREIAADLTQDIFLKVFSKLSFYNFKYKFSTWIYSMSHNHLIDYYRKKKNLSFTSFSSSGDGNVEFKDKDGNTGEEVLNNTEQKEEIWNAVEKLPPEYKELIVMRYINELKYNEISEILNIPMGTLKNKIFRAKKKLFKILGEENEK